MAGRITIIQSMLLMIPFYSMQYIKLPNLWGIVMKVTWGIVTKKESLWVWVLRAKYVKDKFALPTTFRGGPCSFYGGVL